MKDDTPAETQASATNAADLLRRIARVGKYSFRTGAGFVLSLGVDRLLICPLLNRSLGGDVFGGFLWVLGLMNLFGNVAANGVLFLVATGLGAQPSPPAEGAVSGFASLKIIPWVEVNFPPRYLDESVLGLQTWRDSGLASAAIVSTMPGESILFTELKTRVPRLRIIPGLKTMNLLQRFDEVEGWRKVADEVGRLRLAAGNDPTLRGSGQAFLLENEAAMKAYIDGTQTIDLSLLRSGLELLPGDVEYWWYPSIFGNEEKIQERNAAVCEVVQKTLPKVRFLDQRYQGREAVEDRRRKSADLRLRVIRRLPTVPMLYFYGADQKPIFWLDEELGTALDHVLRDWGDGAEVVLYPGVARFPQAAETLRAQLRSLLDKRRP